MNWLMNCLFWVDDVFTKTRDRELDECRRLYRRAIVSLGGTAVCMLLVVVFSGRLEALMESPYFPIPYAAIMPFVWLFFACGVLAFGCLVWSVFAIWKYERG
jgi:hypothetical protein